MLNKGLFACLALAATAMATPTETLIETAVWPKDPPDGLGTMTYPATEKESPFLKQLPAAERTCVDAEAGTSKDPEEKLKDPEKEPAPYIINGKRGTMVGWCGIVRAMQPIQGHKDEFELVVQHCFFDGLTDFHILVVSSHGGGDFKARINPKKLDLKLLSLVRIYGTVTGEEKDMPLVDARYLRVWPQGMFTFMPYGKDQTNPAWKKLCTLDDDHVYSSRPDKTYYRALLEGKGPEAQNENEAGGGEKK